MAPPALARRATTPPSREAPVPVSAHTRPTSPGIAVATCPVPSSNGRCARCWCMNPFVHARNLLAARLTPRRSLVIHACPAQPSSSIHCTRSSPPAPGGPCRSPPPVSRQRRETPRAPRARRPGLSRRGSDERHGNQRASSRSTGAGARESLPWCTTRDLGPQLSCTRGYEVPHEHFQTHSAEVCEEGLSREELA